MNIQGVYKQTVHALSQAFTNEQIQEGFIFIKEVEENSDSVIASMLATEEQMNEIKTIQNNDAVCCQV